jgi:hypothetical protein
MTYDSRQPTSERNAFYHQKPSKTLTNQLTTQERIVKKQEKIGFFQPVEQFKTSKSRFCLSYKTWNILKNRI